MDDSPLIRMAPMLLGELPNHPLFQQGDAVDVVRPDLLPFLLALLDGGNRFIENSQFSALFKHNSHKPAPPSKDGTEVLTHDVLTSTQERVDWSKTGIPGYTRSKPRNLQSEHWFARRSYHKNTSSKEDRSTASWKEFIYGLRDNHSKHEQDFTPTIYDAHHVLDWNDEIQQNGGTWNLASRGMRKTTADYPLSSAPLQPAYTNITLSIYEMCHALPWPLGPRCFPVLVATASTSANRFIAVTVPVDISSFSHALYSNNKNRESGDTAQKRKAVTLALYAAVESVELHQPGNDTVATTAAVDTKSGNPSNEETIQWVMATASDAKGNLPMSVQKSSIPSQVPKDITHFLKWIPSIDRAETENVEIGG